MARYRRTRKYTRYGRKGRWSANIKNITNASITAASNSSFFGDLKLCENPAQNDSTVSQQYTVKNIEMTFEFEILSTVAAANIESLVGYIMYVPQGMVVTETYPNNHPEYIMAYKFIGSPTIDDTLNSTPVVNNRLPVKVKTRLSRRLQTGDKIIFLVTGTNNYSETGNINVNGLIRWWTKAN